MDLAKDIVGDVIRERLTSGPWSTVKIDEKSDPLKEAAVWLTNGLSVSVHILLGHTDCNGKEPSRCDAVQPLEVWTVKVIDEEPTKAAQVMLPMFLKQAVRSQLFFSPIKSWFSENKTDGFCCLYKLSTSSHFEACENAVESHVFPDCRMENRSFLRVHAKWLKKERFPKNVPKCPCKKMDDWVYPGMMKFEDVDSALIPQNVIVERRKKSLSRQNSKEPKEIIQIASCAEATKKNVCASDISSEKALPQAFNAIPGFAEKPQERENAHRKSSASSSIPSSLSSDSLMSDEAEEDAKPEPSSQDSQRSARIHQTKRAIRINQTEVSKDTPKDGHSIIKACALDGFQYKFHPTTKLPMNSSPAPLKRSPQKCLMDKLKERYNEKCQKPEQDTKGKVQIATEETSMPQRRRRVPSGLLCNFEESALNGRLEPVNNVEGFRLQIAVTGSFHVAPITLPVTTFYFSSDGDEAPSLYLGHCSLLQLGRKAIQIPKQCTIQAILFNPQGSVVKIFLVNVNVKDMPPRTKTFIRQRTYSEPTEESPRISTGTCKTGNTVNESHSDTTKEMGRSTLKFLIHLRLASDSRSKVYLHSDIRMLFGNKGNDLEGLDILPTRIHSSTHMPEEYSPIK
ncbi:chromosome segregation during meiosis domain-containing protein [Ditylenchus destructor]|nr:chromosome segregation during meiosis domain-containing protein [Ditylenchus destructor]